MKKEVTVTKEQQEPIQLVSFANKVVVNLPRTKETMIDALKETTLGINNYYKDLNKDSDKKYVSEIQTLNTVRASVSLFDNTIRTTILNLASNKMLTFEMDFCKKMADEFKEVLAEFKKVYPKQCKIFFESLTAEMKASSELIIGYFDSSYILKNLISSILGNPMFIAGSNDKSVDEFFKSPLYGMYFDQFIMLYYSKLINNYRTIWFNALSKCILELDGAPIDLVSQYGTQAIERISNEEVFPLADSFEDIIGFIAVASTYGNTDDIHKLIDDYTDKLWEAKAKKHRHDCEPDVINPIDPDEENNDIQFAFF